MERNEAVARTKPPAQDPSSEKEQVLSSTEVEATTNIKVRPEREPGFKDYIRIFSYATKWDVFAYVAAAIASIGAGILIPAFPQTLPLMNVVFGRLVGDFNSYFLPNPAMAETEFKASLNKQSLYIFFLFLGRFVLGYVNKVCFRMIGIRLSSAIRLQYLQSLFGQTIHVIDPMPSGTAAATITTTVDTLQMGISEKLGTFVEYTVTVVAAIVVAFTYNWSLTLVTASVILFIALAVGILVPFIMKGCTVITKAEESAAAVASETLNSIRMVTACGAQDHMASRYSVWIEKAKMQGKLTSPFVALQFGIIYFALYGAFGLAFWYGNRSYADGRIDNVGTVLIVMMSILMVVISLERVSAPILDVGKATIAACGFFTVIDAPRPYTGSLQDADISATEDIVFRDVTFAYPSRPRTKVLDDLNLTIEAGKVTAIVGPSGSGKSTIVGLVQRWYTLQDQYIIEKVIDQEEKQKDGKKEKNAKNIMETGRHSDNDDDASRLSPAESGPAVELKGSICTSAHALDDIDLKWWRSQIGLVQQEPFLFNETVYQNVAYGLVGSQWESESEEKRRELVNRACQEAFADEFIDRLPDGYDTHVGDGGAKLSGGQRQRLAIARSIVKKPKILILDEATSAIDVRSEQIVQAALDRVSRNRTTVVIAHRLSTIKEADRIIVLQRGRVVETGTHESLLKNPEGVYHGLVLAQQLSLGEPTASTGEDIAEAGTGRAPSYEKSAARSGTETDVKKPEGENRSLVGSYGRLLYEQRSQWLFCILAVLFAMCASGHMVASTPLQAYLFAKVVVIFQEQGQQLIDDGNFWSLMWLVMAIAVGLSYFFMGLITTNLAHYTSATYGNQYFRAILFQETSFFDHEQNSQGTLASRVAGDPKQLQELLGINMAMVYTGAFNLIGAMAIAFAFSKKLALVALCVTMPVGFISSYWRLKYETQFNEMNVAVFAESSKFAAESIGAFRTVASLTIEDVICTRYKKLLQSHVKVATKKTWWTSLIFALSDSVSLACQALIFWYGGNLLARHELGVLSFLICLMAVIHGAEGAGQCLGFGPNAARANAAANRIMDMQETRLRDDIPGSEHIPDTDGGVKIELQDVHFRYPTRGVSVFKGLNVTIEKGQFAALVGASGCGKTSIISLLERFYKILANGKNIRDLNVYKYRKCLSLVAQEQTLFRGTIKENIFLGIDPETPDDQLHQACRDASIHDFIVSLPDGYNTDVGSHGVSLSGGQKQRVAITRALIRNPSILLLDEATSSLDSESEKVVQAAIERAGKGRTMVVVAHRLATVQNADVIFVLGDGKVLEQGSHEELLKNGGVYWHMDTIANVYSDHDMLPEIDTGPAGEAGV
ncbi:Multidrug resistance protein 2 [Tolypocladium ophioglossoides CBS 100239]|uniref:Multidrug resistance protein 2 n=1 Tax=Tolypocladium ophioglossoides (strain CBS 100239) TaxID=1163406 RepID=A0A0L0MWZ3_TOLOC|nr:Multidrug resistance protein 2 [Tolypocladium ophioglossoides CBS 100239]